VFQKALNVSKRVRSETAIGQAAVSVPYAAVQLARQIFGSLKGRKVMILGAGKMSELAVRYLLSHGATAVRVTNRTYEHAVALASQLGGEAVPFEERWSHLAEADIVISSTGCPHFILGVEDVERIRRSRHGRPIFLIDIAVPRNIHPEVRTLPGVFLYDIDDLEQVVARNLAERRSAAAQAEKIVAQEAERFARKLAAVRVVPTIVAVRRRLEEIKEDELRRYRIENSQLDAAQQQAIEEFAARLVESISGRLARELKQAAHERSPEMLAAALRQLFHLPPPARLDAQSAGKVTWQEIL
jgi:glutamyl-tRNA reductase